MLSCSLRLRRAVAPLATIAVFSWLGAEALKADVAFKISGGGVAPTGLPLPGQPPRTHWSEGNATHLGKYSGDGAVQTDFAAYNPDTGAIEGEFGSGTAYTFTAANGDKLVTWYGRTDHGAAQPGQVTATILGVTSEGFLIVEAHWVAEFVIDPNASTGRFAGATGSWIMDAYSEPFVLGSDDPLVYTWEGEGRIGLK